MLELCHLYILHNYWYNSPSLGCFYSKQNGCCASNFKVRILTKACLLQLHREKIKMERVVDAIHNYVIRRTNSVCICLRHMLTRCRAFSEIHIIMRNINERSQASLGSSAWSERIRNEYISTDKSTLRS